MLHQTLGYSGEQALEELTLCREIADRDCSAGNKCWLNSRWGQSVEEGLLRELKADAKLRLEEQVVVSQAQRDRKVIQVEGTACVKIGHL